MRPVAMAYQSPSRAAPSTSGTNRGGNRDVRAEQRIGGRAVERHEAAFALDAEHERRAGDLPVTPQRAAANDARVVERHGPGMDPGHSRRVMPPEKERKRPLPRSVKMTRRW